MNEQNFPFSVQSTHPFPVVRMCSRLVAALTEAKVPFVCADMPEANERTPHSIAAMAQFPFSVDSGSMAYSDRESW